MSDAWLAAPLTFCGRVFTPSELRLIQQIVATSRAWGSMSLRPRFVSYSSGSAPMDDSKTTNAVSCWNDSQQQGLLPLPALQQRGPRGPQRVAATADSDPQPELSGSAGEFEPLLLERIQPDSDASRLWRELIARYHYLSYRVPFGANLRYWVRS
jgi:uncharacterized protein DUF4338